MAPVMLLTNNDHSMLMIEIYNYLNGNGNGRQCFKNISKNFNRQSCVVSAGTLELLKDKVKNNSSSLLPLVLEVSSLDKVF